MLEIEINWPSGRNLAVSAQRRKTREQFDFAPGVASFLAPGVDPAAPTVPMAEGRGIFAGLYTLHYGPTPGATWYDGAYLVGLHDLGPAAPDATTPAAPRCVARLEVAFDGGSCRYLASPFFTTDAASASASGMGS